MFDKVVFDIDDTLWGLNKRVCHRAHVPFQNITTFLVGDNKNLTKDQIEAVVSQYWYPATWTNIKWYKGIDKIKDLEKNYKCEVYLYTNCATEELAKLKVEQAHIATGLPYDRIIANVTNQHHRKRSLEGTYIFVDDSPYNIEQSTAAHVLTLNKPWNKTVYRDVKRFNYLNEIIDYIPTLLQRR